MDYKGVFFNLKDFTLTNTKLGEGAFGSVYIIEKNSDHTKYAAKIIKSESCDGDEQTQIMRESMILSILDHPSILKFLGINFRSLKDHDKYQPTIITEYMLHGSLKRILDKEKKSISDENWSPSKKYICLLGISEAMRYLHAHGILHRDLKPENILIDEDYHPKIGDFGLSKCFPGSLSNSMKLSMTGQVGTALYMPPEMIEGGECGPSVDVYAFAILAYEILTGKEPYYELGNNLTPYQFWNKIIQGTRPTLTSDIPQKTIDLIERCWSRNVSERPSFEEIFNLLSSDFSYSPEDVDSDEINEYLEILKSNGQSDNNDKFKDLTRQCAKIFEDKFNQLDTINDLLCFACFEGYYEVVKLLLSNESIDINAKVILLYIFLYNLNIKSLIPILANL